VTYEVESEDDLPATMYKCTGHGDDINAEVTAMKHHAEKNDMELSNLAAIKMRLSQRGMNGRVKKVAVIEVTNSDP